jgi:hypothetical protein
MKRPLLSAVLLNLALGVAQSQIAKAESHFFFGVSGGLVRVGETTFPEREKDGGLLGVKALFSRSTEAWVYDAGFGFFRSFVRSDTFGVANYSVATQAGFLEIAAAHRLTQRIQAGLLAHLWMGTDVTFSQATNDSPLAGLVGAKIQYAIPIPSALLRVGASFITDLTISNRQLLLGLLNVEFGFALN